MMHNSAKLFGEITSIRGVGKVVRSKGLFLRICWLSFVVLMLGLLIYSVARLFSEYIAYNTIVQTKVLQNKAMAFPAITLCSHNPFSSRALSLWKKGVYMSPHNFSEGLRQRAKQLMTAGQVHNASNLIYYDSSRHYYQTLGLKAARELGFKADELVRYCWLSLGIRSLIGDVGSCGLVVRQWSHTQYFNCYTLQPKAIKSESVESLRLMLSLGTKDDLKEPSRNNAFVFDLFTPRLGVRMLIHEPNILPLDLDKQGMHIEAGKTVDIVYQAFKHHQQSTPKQQCLSPDQYRSKQIVDLGQTFNYTSLACQSRAEAEVLLKHCNCVLSYKPRAKTPDDKTPFCGKIDAKDPEDFFRRLDCFISFQEQHLQERPATEVDECLPRCEYMRYASHISSTNWDPSDWQLHWTFNLTKALDTATMIGDEPNERDISAAHKYIKHYLTTDTKHFKPKTTNYYDKGHFAFVTIKRESRDTILRAERLQLTENALFSRVGGVCSLYLGLTCAIFVEIVEFIYMFARQSYERKKEEKELQQNQPQNEELIMMETNSRSLNLPPSVRV